MKKFLILVLLGVTSVFANSPQMWNGQNPFFQPYSTTNYQGSGDVNLDGVVDINDVTEMHNMIINNVAKSSRADIDGSGVIDNTDSTILMGYINYGGNLPAWWSYLPSRGAREARMASAINLDSTNNYIYFDHMQCVNFQAQFYIGLTGYNKDLYSTHWNGGQTAFNIPVYCVTIVNTPGYPSYSHGINAVLVGDNPLIGTDWKFIEPQTDYDVTPGMWDLPYNSRITICVPNNIVSNGWNPMLVSDGSVTFDVLSDGTFQYVNSMNMQTSRGVFYPSPIDNRIDYWSPIVLTNNKLLFERVTDNTFHNTNIFLSSLPYTDPIINSTCLSPATMAMRVLDAKTAPDGNVRVLWKSHNKNSKPSIYYGILDTLNKSLNNITLLYENNSYDSTPMDVICSKILIKSNNDINIFWLQSVQSGVNTGDIYYTKYNGSTWTTPTIIASPSVMSHPLFDNHEWQRYQFDVAQSGNKTVLVYIDNNPNIMSWAMKYITYTTSWSSPLVIDSATIRGCNMVSTSNGNIHLLYWLGQEGWLLRCERGNLLYKKYDGATWNATTTIDNRNASSCAKIIQANDNIFATWEYTDNDITYPVLGNMIGTSWNFRTLSIDTGINVWYPSLTYTSNSHLIASWSARKSNRASVGIYDTIINTCNNISITNQPSNTTVTVGSSATFSVTATGTTPQYQWQKSTGSTYYSSISGATSSFYNTGTTTTSMNQYKYRCIVNNTCPSNVLSNAGILTVIPNPTLTLGQALDKPNLTWLTGRGYTVDSLWYPQTSISYYGGSAARSGHVISDCGHDSWIKTTVTGPDTVRFYWKVSSESKADYLKFYIGSSKKAQISGNVNWQSKKFYVPSGTQTLKWVYIKDCGDDIGSDCSWLDYVRLDNQ